MRNNARQKWIGIGYELFAKEGPDGIQIERLARILKLNKSGFYHYFETPENFILQLFKYHRNTADQMAMEIQVCESLDPDYFNVVVKFKMFMLIQGQLARRRNNFLYNTVFNTVNDITNNALFPLWQKTFGLPNDPELVIRHISFFRNTFLAQANFITLTHTLLYDVMMEGHAMMNEVFRYQHFDLKKRPKSLETAGRHSLAQFLN